MVGRRALLQVALGTLAAAGASGALTRSAQAGREVVYRDEVNNALAMTTLRSDFDGTTFMVRNQQPVGQARNAVYTWLGPTDAPEPLKAPAAVAGVNFYAAGAGVYGRGHGGTDVIGVHGESFLGVAVKAESEFGTALEVKGDSSYSGPARFDSSVVVKGSLIADKGSLIKGLSAHNITLGTLNDARLSNNIPRKDAGVNEFSGKLKAKSVEAIAVHASALVKTHSMRAESATMGFIQGTGGRAPRLASAGVVVVPVGKRVMRVRSPFFTGNAIVIATAQSSPPITLLRHVYRSGPDQFSFVLDEANDRVETQIAYLAVQV